MAQDKKSATKFVDAVLKSVKAHEDYEEKAFAMAKDKVHSRKPAGRTGWLRVMCLSVFAVAGLER